MLNQRKQDERRSLEAANLLLLNKTIETQCERIKSLESLLARFRNGFAYPYSLDEKLRKQIIEEIDAMLPKSEEVKDGN